jgi:hypothetical protein
MFIGVPECFCVEARWEQTRESPAHEKFFTIDSYCENFDAAKSTANAYFSQHVASEDTGKLEWVAGVLKGRRCWYAHTPFITFRISR